MTRALALPEGQLRALMRAARKEGVRLEVKVGEAVVTVFPTVHTPETAKVDARKKGHF